MKKQVQLHTFQIPPVSREFAEQLDKIFRAIEIKHDTPESLIRYSGGQRSVVDYVMRNSVHREVSGDPAKLRHNQQELTFFQRLFKSKQSNAIT